MQPVYFKRKPHTVNTSQLKIIKRCQNTFATHVPEEMLHIRTKWRKLLAYDLESAWMVCAETIFDNLKKVHRTPLASSGCQKDVVQILITVCIIICWV